MLRIAQQEAVLLFVQLPHLLLDAAQESQLREMSQCEVGALVELPLAGLLLEGGVQEGAKRCLCQMAYKIALLIPFLVPGIRIAAIIGDALRQYTLVENAVLQFFEEAVDASLAIAEVIDAESLLFHYAEELVADALHALQGPLTDFTQLLLILLEEVLAVHQLAQLLAVFLVEVAEDGEPELLDLSDDVPSAVVADVVHDILHQPLQ